MLQIESLGLNNKLQSIEPRKP